MVKKRKIHKIVIKDHAPYNMGHIQSRAMEMEKNLAKVTVLYTYYLVKYYLRIAHNVICLASNFQRSIKLEYNFVARLT